jgi:dTDP-3-amino-3,4,6-trideoxy-alpha-D-glucose transaminase
MYRAGLADAAVTLPADRGAAHDHVFHLFVVRTEHRDALRAHLESCGVASAVHYPVPVHATEAFAAYGQPEGTLPAAERLSGEIVSLPLWPTMEDAEVEAVIAAVRAFRPDETPAGDAS